MNWGSDQAWSASLTFVRLWVPSSALLGVMTVGKKLKPSEGLRVWEALDSSPSSGGEVGEWRQEDHKIQGYLLSYAEIEASLDYMILLNE